MSIGQMHDIGAWLGHAPALNYTAQTASATDAAINGVTYDRQAARNRFQSATAIVVARGTITSGFTLSMNVQFQDSPNNSDWTNYGDALGSTLILDAAAGAISDHQKTVKHTVDLANAARYLRYVATPTLSQTQTSTGLFYGVLVFGGAEELPPDVVSPDSDATP